MAVIFDIDKSDIVEYTNKLERMHRSSLPVSIRGALNDAAFDMKKNTIEKYFKENFTTRNKTFIRAHTAFNKSPNTFDINQMQSSAGVIEGKSKSGDNLEKQEFGGTIKKRGAIPYDTTRVGGSNARKMKKIYYYKKFRNAKKGRVSRTSKETIIKTERSLLRVTKGGEWSVLYRIQNTVTIKKDPFMKPATDETTKKIPDFFVKQAERRIK